jgi:hypothetical protein
VSAKVSRCGRQGVCESVLCVWCECGSVSVCTRACVRVCVGVHMCVSHSERGQTTQKVLCVCVFNIIKHRAARN